MVGMEIVLWQKFYNFRVTNIWKVFLREFLPQSEFWEKPELVKFELPDVRSFERRY